MSGSCARCASCISRAAAPAVPACNDFTQTHFGRHAGYAQQYLFHYMRTGGKAK